MNVALLNQALQTAVKEGNFPFIKELLKRGAEVNSRSSMGWTPLMTLIFHCKAENRGEIAQYLIDNGADVHARNSYQGSALGIAMEFGDMVHIDVLVNAGVSINEVDNDYGRYGRKSGLPRETPLINAIRKKNHTLVVGLLDCGADPTIPDAKGNTPQELALVGGDMTLLTLIENAMEPAAA